MVKLCIENIGRLVYMKLLENRNIKNVILFSFIIIFIVVYRLFIYSHLLKYSESISASFSILLLFGSIALLGFKKSNPNELKNNFLKTIVICVILYFISTYGVGLAVGFLSNSYSLSPLAILDNAFYTLIMIISFELFRYVFINANKDKKISIVLITILLTLFEINLFIKNDTFGEISNIFKFLTLTCLPVFMKHILCSYSSYYTDYKPALAYRLIMDLYFYIVPIQPDLGDYLVSVLTLVLPFMILMYLSRYIDNSKKIKKHEFKTKIIRLSDIPVMALMIVFAFVIMGIGPYKLVGIETGSMTPSIKIGDAVVIDKTYDKNKLKEKDIIAYINSDNILVVHRIIRINSDGTYVTKGDYNNTADSGFVKESQIQGKVAFKIPFIAYPAIKFKQK